MLLIDSLILCIYQLLKSYYIQHFDIYEQNQVIQCSPIYSIHSYQQVDTTNFIYISDCSMVDYFARPNFINTHKVAQYKINYWNYYCDIAQYLFYFCVFLENFLMSNPSGWVENNLQRFEKHEQWHWMLKVVGFLTAFIPLLYKLAGANQAPAVPTKNIQNLQNPNEANLLFWPLNKTIDFATKGLKMIGVVIPNKVIQIVVTKIYGFVSEKMHQLANNQTFRGLAEFSADWLTFFRALLISIFLLLICKKDGFDKELYSATLSYCVSNICLLAKNWIKWGSSIQNFVENGRLGDEDETDGNDGSNGGENRNGDQNKNNAKKNGDGSNQGNVGKDGIDKSKLLAKKDKKTK